MRKLSVIIPFYNEAECIEKIYSELTHSHSVSLSHYDLEILFMDNHSSDASFQIASQIAASDKRVKVLRLSRNFGYQANILTGLLNATGDAAVQLDADGEDDPAIISEMVRYWEQGYKVVYGIRKRRIESPLLSLQRWLFYRLLKSLAKIDIPLDAGDFRLMDRQVLEGLKLFKEANPYLRGLISFVGFEQKGIPYDRRKRYAGKSKFRWWDYLNLAWDGITSFSAAPLRLATWLGLSIAGGSAIGMCFYLGLYLMGRIQVQGFTTLIIIHLLLAGVQLVCIGLLGIYVGSIFEEVKQRPRSIIERSIPSSSHECTEKRTHQRESNVA